jgi:hypothetical protein
MWFAPDPPPTLFRPMALFLFFFPVVIELSTFDHFDLMTLQTSSLASSIVTNSTGTPFAREECKSITLNNNKKSILSSFTFSYLVDNFASNHAAPWFTNTAT